MKRLQWAADVRWIERFTELQRIKAAVDKEKNEYQLSIAGAQIEALGIPTESLEIK